MRNKSIVFFVIGILSLTALGIYLYVNPDLNLEVNNEVEEPYIAFVSEVYDNIKENYWSKINDDQLSNIFKLAVEKTTEQSQALTTPDKAGVEEMIRSIVASMNDDQKKDFVTKSSATVLVNLEPFGRSKLFSEEQERALRNTVENINPDKDLYASLGIDKEASPQEIEEAYQKKVESIKTPEEKEEIAYARDVLVDEDKRERYNKNGAEPTTSARLISPEIAYIRIDRFSPTTFDEFRKDAEKLDEGEDLNSLVLDLRGNIGGAIDLLPYFLGPFIGPDQYAYEFFHQDEKIPFKTKVGWLNSLVRYKKMVILIDENTQSSAEVMAATLKKYNVGIVIGTKTRGHGTIEKLIPIEQRISETEKYSLFLVENLTIRDDGKTIEDNGVEPVININDDTWKAQLLSYFNYTPLVQAVETVWKEGY